MTRNPALNALLERERLADAYRAALLGDRRKAEAALAALRAKTLECLMADGK
ncbi:MAG: hypothetical protein RL268_1986 [Pseudomonadota bacterium]|jgi:DNA-binding transcriptional regulator LsrR (DeoR family)